jgi:hypothetical protein
MGRQSKLSAGRRLKFLTLPIPSSAFLLALACHAQAQSTQRTSPPEPIVGDDAPAESDTNLAKKIQNPIGDLISFPFQSNTNFGYGPHRAYRRSSISSL